jgi:putative ABC transport system substrate-binding protein
MLTDFTGKPLEILKDCLPTLSSTGLLMNPNSPFARQIVEDAQGASRTAKIPVSLIEAGKPEELKHAFSEIERQKLSAIMVGVDAMLYNQRKQIADLAIAHRLPTIGAAREMAEAGLLMSYGPEFSDLFRRAGVYIDKILKGAKPADMPVERPTKFNLVVNMTTARAIGTMIPDSTQLLADRIIE